MINFSKDLGRTLDYLQIRKDIDSTRSRYDQTFPVEASQLPLFHFLGTSSNDKKHVIYEAGHGDLPRREEVRESLDWLDRYLGAIRQ